tara:strand:- start:316 stop:1179 length:864 start_codon:yes stop_codon:yes gene_type:complete
MEINKNCSVLIPYFNKPDSIEAVLSAIVNFRKELDPWILTEILVLVDGCSPPEQVLPTITRCINLKENRGLANARNLLIRECKGDFIIFFDADAVPKVGSLSSIVQHWDGKSLIAGTEDGSPEKGLANKFRRYFWVQTQGHKALTEAPYFFGLVFAAPTEILRKVGDFDNKMGNYGEDIEYSIRLRKMGFNIQYEPNFKVFHQRYDSLLSIIKLIYYHSKSQILAHQLHQCSIMDIVKKSFIWIFVASGSALKTHRSLMLFWVTVAYCTWSFCVKLFQSVGGTWRRQ